MSITINGGKAARAVWASFLGLMFATALVASYAALTPQRLDAEQLRPAAECKGGCGGQQACPAILGIVCTCIENVCTPVPR